MNYLDAIVEIKNIVSPKFISNVIPLIDHKAKKHLEVRGQKLAKDIRNVKGYHLNFDTPTNVFYWNYIKAEIQRLYIFYKAKFPFMSSEKINQIDLLKYSPGGQYKVHTDHFTTAIRHLSVIINLNDNYEGGDLVFTDQKEQIVKKFKLGKGSIIFFPSNFLYPHRVTEITQGVRYTFVSWVW